MWWKATDLLKGPWLSLSLVPYEMELLPEGFFTTRSSEKQMLGHEKESLPLVPTEETAAAPQREHSETKHSPQLLKLVSAVVLRSPHKIDAVEWLLGTRLLSCTSKHLRSSMHPPSSEGPLRNHSVYSFTSSCQCCNVNIPTGIHRAVVVG